MTIYVTEAKQRGKGMTKPQALPERYQSGEYLHHLVETHPDAIYFSDNLLEDGLLPTPPTAIPEPSRRRATIGSPEEYVRQFTDLQLQDRDLVTRMTRGLHWEPEPERFLAAAEDELAWRREQGVSFGWHRR